MPWISRTWLMAAWIGFLFFSIPSATHALLGTIETELGYDSNPGLVYSNENGPMHKETVKPGECRMVPWKNMIICNHSTDFPWGRRRETTDMKLYQRFLA